VAPWYRGIDLFVLPTLNESFSNSLLEAMACGCCVVATAVGGNPELVIDGHNGMLFEPGNVEQLTDRLETALASTGLRRRLAADARRTIEAGYTNAAAAAAMADLYERHLAARRRS
jgi:glycosyltransferase involved in cell wall biosynthesis